MKRYHWADWGDVNAFFGLMLDNVAVMVLLVGTISSATPPEQQEGRYTFTREFVVTRMIPGTALGVLIGDLVYTWMAFRLARRTGRSDVTAMPLGLDTPSTIGVALLVLLPALQDDVRRQALGQPHPTAEQHAWAMLFAWHVGVAALLLVGVFKVLCAPVGNAVRRWVPRAGLLGSLAAAIGLILAGPAHAGGKPLGPPAQRLTKAAATRIFLEDSKIAGWLREAGFISPRTLDAPGPSPLILANRPACPPEGHAGRFVSERAPVVEIPGVRLPRDARSAYGSRGTFGIISTRGPGPLRLPGRRTSSRLTAESCGLP